MNSRQFLLIHSAIYAAFAIGLFFLAEQLWPIYGLEINDQYALFLSQHNSILLGGIAIIGFLFCDQEANGPVMQRLMLGLALTNLLGFIITLYACLNSIFVGFGWSDPAFFALLVVLSLWQYRKSKAI